MSDRTVVSEPDGGCSALTAGVGVRQTAYGAVVANFWDEQDPERVHVRAEDIPALREALAEVDEQ